MKILPIVLKRKFGRQKHYTERDIRAAIKIANLNIKHINYAFAIFLSEQSFVKIIGINSDYDTLREYVAKKYFKGNSKFSIHDLLKNANRRLDKKWQKTFDGNVSGSEYVE